MDKERALRTKTNEKLDSIPLRSTPQFYELWYRYFDNNPEIVRAIDQHEGPIDEAFCLKTYNRYIGNTAQETAVQRTGDKIQGSILELAGMLQSAIAATADYSGQMDGAAQKIQSASNISDLSAVVADIIAQTRKVINKNQALENQLKHSYGEVQELRQYLETARKDATIDGVTGISNRKAFDRNISINVDEANSAHTPLILMMLDIDHFKKFNDTYGHPTGDQVLRLVAQTLVANVKGRDMAARYGGEEFAILLPGTSLKAGIQVAEILRRSIEEKEISDKANNVKLGGITLSIGVAKYREAESISSFVERADAALYKAKNTGRNRVCVAVENTESPRTA